MERATQPEAEDAADPSPSELAEVTRSVDIVAPADEVWQVIADPDQRGLWLDDEDALARATTPAETAPVSPEAPGRSVSWTWWHPGEDTQPSRVEITVAPGSPGTTRVTVTEQLVGHHEVVRASASGQAMATTAPQLLWDRRLLGLELLFVAVGLGVGMCVA